MEILRKSVSYEHLTFIDPRANNNTTCDIYKNGKDVKDGVLTVPIVAFNNRISEYYKITDKYCATFGCYLVTWKDIEKLRNQLANREEVIETLTLKPGSKLKARKRYKINKLNDITDFYYIINNKLAIPKSDYNLERESRKVNLVKFTKYSGDSTNYYAKIGQTCIQPYVGGPESEDRANFITKLELFCDIIDIIDKFKNNKQSTPKL